MNRDRIRILFSLCCVLLAVPVGMVIASAAAMALSVTVDGPYGIFMNYVLIFGFVIAVSLVLARTTGMAVPKMEFSVPVPAVLWGFMSLVAWNITVTPLAEYLPENGSDQLENIVNTGVWSVMTALVIAPFMEEWIFRGVLAGNLCGLTGKLWAIAVSAAIFAASHVYPVQVITAFGAGLVLGALYVRTGSVVPTVFMHVLYNSFIYLLYVMFPSDEDDLLVSLIPSEAVRMAIWAAALLFFAATAVKLVRDLQRSAD